MKKRALILALAAFLIGAVMGAAVPNGAVHVNAHARSVPAIG